MPNVTTGHPRVGCDRNVHYQSFEQRLDEVAYQVPSDYWVLDSDPSTKRSAESHWSETEIRGIATCKS